jgi:hypothetical protein
LYSEDIFNWCRRESAPKESVLQTLIDNTEIGLLEIGMGGVDWIDVVQDR